MQQWLDNTAATLQGTLGYLFKDSDNWNGKSTGLKDKTSLKIDQKAARKREDGIRKKKKPQKENK